MRGNCGQGGRDVITKFIKAIIMKLTIKASKVNNSSAYFKGLRVFLVLLLILRIYFFPVYLILKAKQINLSTERKENNNMASSNTCSLKEIITAATFHLYQYQSLLICRIQDLPSVLDCHPGSIVALSTSLFSFIYYCFPISSSGFLSAPELPF